MEGNNGVSGAHNRKNGHSTNKFALIENNSDKNTGVAVDPVKLTDILIMATSALLIGHTADDPSLIPYDKHNDDEDTSKTLLMSLKEKTGPADPCECPKSEHKNGS